MPIPKPRKDEEKDKFMQRCMSDSTMVKEYKGSDQRYAICNTSWKDKKVNMSREISLEFMAIGNWNGHKFTKDRLKKIIENFKKLREVHKVPLKIGHADKQIDCETRSEDQHALGWVEDIWLNASNKLMAKLTDVPDIVYNAISKKLYRKVSAEIDMGTTYKGKELGDVLSGIALIGADIPAVNTLEDLQAFFVIDSSIAEGERISFTTIETDYAKEDLDMSTDLKEFEKRLDSLNTRFDALQEENKKLIEENNQLKADKANFEREAKEREELEKKEAIKLARDTVTDILNKGVEGKTITPAQREDFSKMLGTDDDEAVTKIDLELVKRMVGKGSINFSTKTTSSNEGGENLNTDVKKPDEELVQEINKILARGDAKDFSAAKRLVFNANPKLAESYKNQNDGGNE